MRQRPDTAMHMAPWAKASISNAGGASWCSRAISARDISRAHTTRVAPSSYHTRAAAPLATEAWVLTWRSTRGATSPATAKAPKSLMMKASTPAASRARKNAGSPSMSSGCMRMLQVTCTFTPCSWAKATAAGMSAMAKFAARARMPNFSAARYTASAPNRTAARNCSMPPAGASNSIGMGDNEWRTGTANLISARGDRGSHYRRWARPPSAFRSTG